MIAFSENHYVERLLGATASGTSTIDSGWLSLAHGENVGILLEVSSVTGVTVQLQATPDGGTTVNNLGSALTPVAADKPLLLSYLDAALAKGSQVRVRVARASAAAIGPIYGIAMSGRKLPVTQQSGGTQLIVNGGSV